MTRTISRAARARGVSLIEGVLYLVVALAVIIGGIVFFQQAQLSSRVSETSRGVTGTVEQTRDVFRHDASYGNAFIEHVVLAAKAAPETMITDDDYTEAEPDHLIGFGVDGIGVVSEPRDGGLRHSWGGSVEMYGGSDWFSVRLNDLPIEACLRLAPVSRDGTGALGTGIFAMNINGAVVTPTRFPLTADTIAAHCGDPGFLEIGFARTPSGAEDVAARIDGSVELMPETSGGSGDQDPEDADDGATGGSGNDDGTGSDGGSGGTPGDDTVADGGTGTGRPAGVPEPFATYSSEVWPAEWGTTPGWNQSLTSSWLDTSFIPGDQSFEIVGNVNATLQRADGSRGSSGDLASWGTNLEIDPPACGETAEVYVVLEDGRSVLFTATRPEWPQEWGTPPAGC